MDLSINEGTLVVTGGPGDTLQTAIVIKKTPRGLSAAGAEFMLSANGTASGRGLDAEAAGDAPAGRTAGTTPMRSCLPTDP